MSLLRIAGPACWAYLFEHRTGKRVYVFHSAAVLLQLRLGVMNGSDVKAQLKVCVAADTREIASSAEHCVS